LQLMIGWSVSNDQSSSILDHRSNTNYHAMLNGTYTMA
jgi:hypothetical protein